MPIETYREGIEKAWEAHKQAQRERQEAALQDVIKAEAKLKADLMAPDGVEGYVRSGRVPFFQDVLAASGDSEMEEVVHCHVPPEGTQLGDIMVRIPGGAYLFKALDGGARIGIAATLELTPQEGALLQARVEAAPRPIK